MKRIPLEVIIRDSQSKDSKDPHWFTEDTLSWWECKLPNFAYQRDDDSSRAFFYTSEASRNMGIKRAFSVRCWDFAEHRMETIGEFHSYRDKEAALDAMRELLEAPHVVESDASEYLPGDV